MEFAIYTDGAARGNPGDSASGYYIFVNDRLIAKRIFYNGIKTNNNAEYIAVISALKKIAEEYGYSNGIKLFSDSELVVNQLKKNYKVKDEKLKEYNKEAMGLISKFDRCDFASVPRTNRYISMVDKDLNKLLDNINKEGRANSIRKKGHQKDLF